jgi:hypothetical protein
VAGAVNLIALFGRPASVTGFLFVAWPCVARSLSAAMSYAAAENTKEYLPPPMSALGGQFNWSTQHSLS